MYEIICTECSSKFVEGGRCGRCGSCETVNNDTDLYDYIHVLTSDELITLRETYKKKTGVVLDVIKVLDNDKKLEEFKNIFEEIFGKNE